MREWKLYSEHYNTIFTLACFIVYRATSAQFDNYHNWPERSQPVVKTEVQVAGRETRIRCQINQRFRYIQNGLSLTWEYKSCHAPCLDRGDWIPLCGSPHKPCPSIFTLVEPTVQDSGMYRCHITVDSVNIVLNIYLLQFIAEKRKEPPVIVAGMESNVTVMVPQVVALTCRVQSSVVPTVRWFHRLHSLPAHQGNYVQYLNNTYKYLHCCPVAALREKGQYLSKLVFTANTMLDSGFYVCLAINDVNYTFRESYVSVLPALALQKDTKYGESFAGLFLIPMMFVLIPVLAWVTCRFAEKTQKPPSTTGATSLQ